MPCGRLREAEINRGRKEKKKFDSYDTTLIVNLDFSIMKNVHLRLNEILLNEL